MDKKNPETEQVDFTAIALVLGNIDLMFEIFLRLPAKSLIRLKLVSKHWLSFISNPEFAIMHTRQTHQKTIKTPICNFLYQDFNRDMCISLHGRTSFPARRCLNDIKDKTSYNPMIVHSCNGLILFKQANGRRIVFNPTTQSYRLLTIPSYSENNSTFYDSFIVFEPLRSHHYKTVTLCSRYRRENFRVLIFSSESGSWNEFPIPATEDKCCTRKIYCNGAIHWLTNDKFHLQIDVDSETMIKTPILDFKLKTLFIEKIEYFGENNGRLLLIKSHRFGAPNFEVLEMDIDTRRWALKHCVNLKPLALEIPEMNRHSQFRVLEYSVLYMHSSDDMKSFTLILAIPGNVILYDGKEYKSLMDTDMEWEFAYSTRFRTGELGSFVYPLIQCLAPV